MMLPVIDVLVLGTVGRNDYTGSPELAPLYFTINGHLFEFRGTHGERFSLERDLTDARKVLNAARSVTQDPRFAGK
jgi:hypothetical protein